MLPVRAFRCGFDDVLPATLHSLGRDLDTFFGRVPSARETIGLGVDIRQDGDDLVVEGGEHPLVIFALGYNTYMLALERHTVDGPQGGRVVVRDPEGFLVLDLPAQPVGDLIASSS